MKLLDYWRISRPDNITKHVFIIPGIFLALIYQPFQIEHLQSIFIGILSSVLAASANYTINEFIDHKTDKYHPLKKVYLPRHKPYLQIEEYRKFELHHQA